MKLSSSDLNADLTAAVASSLWILLALAVIVPAIACATLRQRGRSLDGGTQKAFIGARFLAIMTQMVLTIAVVAPGSRFPVASIAASLHPDYAASPAKVAALDTTLRATLNWYGAAAIIVLLVELGGVAVHCATASGDAVDLFCESRRVCVCVCVCGARTRAETAPCLRFDDVCACVAFLSRLRASAYLPAVLSLSHTARTSPRYTTTFR